MTSDPLGSSQRATTIGATKRAKRSISDLRHQMSGAERLPLREAGQYAVRGATGDISLGKKTTTTKRRVKGSSTIVHRRHTQISERSKPPPKVKDEVKRDRRFIAAGKGTNAQLR